MEKAYNIAVKFAQALPASNDRAKAYEIAACAKNAGDQGIAFAIANDHRTDDAIFRAMQFAEHVGIAKEHGTADKPKIVFLDGSIWERDGCSPAGSHVQ